MTMFLRWASSQRLCLSDEALGSRWLFSSKALRLASDGVNRSFVGIRTHSVLATVYGCLAYRRKTKARRLPGFE